MTASAAPADQYVTMASSLQYHDEVVGTGPEPQTGQTVDVHYTGWLYDYGAKGPCSTARATVASRSASNLAQAA